jgi:hypothetical protein
MDIQLEKQELIKLLQETQDFAILKKVRKVFQKEQKDWWDELPNSAKEGIKEGLKDIKNDRVVSYDEVKKQFGWK